MPTLAQIKATIESRLTSRLADIAQKQSAFFVEHGRYWQGLETSSAAPADGVDVTPDRVDSRADGESKSWQDMGGLPPMLGSQLRVDTYDGPQGKGYVFVARIRVAGQLHERRWNFGPDMTQEADWRLVDERLTIP